MRPAPASPIDAAADRRPSHRPFTWNYVPCLGLLRLEGELDLAGIEELRVALVAAEDPARALTVDLAGLDFIDCAALAGLFRLAGRMSRAGRRLVLAGDHGQVARLLDLTGLPAGAERLSDGPHLRLASGPWAGAEATAPGGGGS